MTFLPEQIEAAATVVGAGASFGIPLVLAWMGSASKRRDDRKAEAAEMRQFSVQWQEYNLALATSADAAAAVCDQGFWLGAGDSRRRMTGAEVQCLHTHFFKLTALYQVFYALKRGTVEPKWATLIINDLAPTLPNDEIVDVALDRRGYDELFVEHVNAARGGTPLPTISRESRFRWWHYLTSWAIIGLAIADVAITAAGVAASFHTESHLANNLRCTAIQRDMLSASPKRLDGPDLFQALGCRPQGEGSVYAPPAPKGVPKG